MDKFGVEDTVFCEVDITTFYNCTRSPLQTAKFAHMNGHWKDYNNMETKNYIDIIITSCKLSKLMWDS